jgi:hypothetical protein
MEAETVNGSTVRGNVRILQRRSVVETSIVSWGRSRWDKTPAARSAACQRSRNSS